MRPWTWVRRILALVVTVVFTLGIFATPVLAKTKSFGSGSRSFSAPRSTAPKTRSPSRSFSTPKPTAPSKSTAPSTSPSRSFSTPAPPSTTTDSKSFSSGSRSFSSPDGSFSNKKPSSSSLPTSPPATYDPGKTRYPTSRPVVVVGPTVFDPWYYHDYYYGRPWYWRIWYRPHYTASGGWAISWVAIAVGLVGLWILLGVLSSITAKRRRNR